MSIWHDNTESPDSTKVVCAICLDKEEKVLKYTVFPEGSFLKHIDILKILKWSYEEDLIKSAFKEPVGYALREPAADHFFGGTIYVTKKEAKQTLERFIENKINTEVVALYD